MCCVYTYLISCFGQEPDPEIELASGEPSDSYQACRDYHMATRVLAANLSLCLTIHSLSLPLIVSLFTLSLPLYSMSHYSLSLFHVSLFTVYLPLYLTIHCLYSALSHYSLSLFFYISLSLSLPLFHSISLFTVSLPLYLIIHSFSSIISHYSLFLFHYSLFLFPYISLLNVSLPQYLIIHFLSSSHYSLFRFLFNSRFIYLVSSTYSSFVTLSLFVCFLLYPPIHCEAWWSIPCLACHKCHQVSCCPISKFKKII